MIANIPSDNNLFMIISSLLKRDKNDAADDAESFFEALTANLKVTLIIIFGVLVSLILCSVTKVCIVHIRQKEFILLIFFIVFYYMC